MRGIKPYAPQTKIPYGSFWAPLRNGQAAYHALQLVLRDATPVLVVPSGQTKVCHREIADPDQQSVGKTMLRSADRIAAMTVRITTLVIMVSISRTHMSSMSEAASGVHELDVRRL